jgi:ArsR family transcriptional regulator
MSTRIYPWYSGTVPKPDKTADMERLLRALADRTRLRLLNLMGDTEICVCFFVEVLGTNQPKISRHLSYLRNAGIVRARRDGKWMHYQIAEPSDPALARVLGEVMRSFNADPEMQRDRSRLERMCCGPDSLVELMGAPLPVPSMES